MSASSHATPSGSFPEQLVQPRPERDVHTHTLDRAREHRPIRVLHFVTGGFSGGATQVAIALVQAAQQGKTLEPLLVLRRKSHTPKERVAELAGLGLPMATVPGWAHVATIWSLIKICRKFRPDVLIAHGFSEHLWGRYAGLLAGVPHLVHVEHNTKERYSAWRLMQSRWLAKRTDCIVGCSEGVRRVLLEQGMPEARVRSIANGIRLQAFAGAEFMPFGQRQAGIVMVARLAKQKNHACLLHAVALLAQRGQRPNVYFAGGGKEAFRQPLEQLARQLGIAEQVQFLGVIRNVPELLMQNQIAALSTHYEGMPLSLIEGMAAGCAVIGSDVPGVRELIHDGVDGRLVRADDASAWADALQELLERPQSAEKMARAGQLRAFSQFSRERMNADYEALCLELCGKKTHQG